jgi:uncharacterized protein (DUF1800 family)
MCRALMCLMKLGQIQDAVMPIDAQDPHNIAITRFGLGGHAAEPKAAIGLAGLLSQLSRYDPRPPAIAALPGREAVAVAMQSYKQVVQVVRQSGQERKDGGGTMPFANPMETQAKADADKAVVRDARRDVREHYLAAVYARFANCLVTPTPFAERLVHFWANHFAVSIDKLPVVATAGLLEMEAVRPNLLGKFAAMVQAVERHPAMLIYLDQAQSIGPNSMFGARIAARGKRKAGLNENLAREILELHTLGVRTGYTQADVTEFARAMTGFTVAGLGAQAVQGPMAGKIAQAAEPGSFIFVDPLHEPGTRNIMGRNYTQSGEAQATAILNDLAVHPDTAKHLSFKLARHFVADDPPAALVDRLAKAFLTSGGDLSVWYSTLINSPESWAPQQAKYKTPWEWAVSTARAAGLVAPLPAPQLARMFDQLGQPVWRPGSPAGYDDTAASWLGPDALLRRVEVAPRLIALAPRPIDPRSLALALLGRQLRADTLMAIERAESPAQAMALLSLSPEFLRR